MLLELGGKAPLVVLDDADIDGAVNAAVFGAFMNQGQICMSTERIIVDATIADAFVERFAAQGRGAAGRRSARPCRARLAHQPRSRGAVAALIADAVAEGRHAGGRRRRRRHVMPATVLDHVTPEMRIYSEESFGPVAPVIRVEGDERGDRSSPTIPNTASPPRSSAGTCSARWRWRGASSRASATSTARPSHDEAQMPFGGVKSSGYGRFGGKAAIDDFTDLRWVTIEDPGQPYPFLTAAVCRAGGL